MAPKTAYRRSRPAGQRPLWGRNAHTEFYPSTLRGCSGTAQDTLRMLRLKYFTWAKRWILFACSCWFSYLSYWGLGLYPVRGPEGGYFSHVHAGSRTLHTGDSVGAVHNCSVACCLVRWLAGQLVFLAGWQAVWLAGAWPAGPFAGYLALGASKSHTQWLAGWLAGWLASR